MRIFTTKMCFCFLLAIFCAGVGFAQTTEECNENNIQIFVSPDGDDNNPGTEAQPLASLTGARDAVRRIKKVNKKALSVLITIKDGRYEMREPLLLLPQDGGTEEYPVVYSAEEGAVPVFSGGKTISGFKVLENGIWEVVVPECKRYNWRFDQLYVNGKRAILARTPNKGFLKIGGVNQHIWERGTERVADKAQQILSFDEDNFASLQNITDEEVEDVRFRAYHKWDFTMRYLDKMEKDSTRIYTSGKGMKPWNPLFKGGRIVFENYAAALDDPGEWYLNHHGTLYYFPRSGETPENTEIVAPVLENLISVEGDAVNNNLVENIRFEGIAFTHCHYKIPKTGSEPNQAAALINAAVMLEGAKNISFVDCEISQTGQHALWFGKGCSDSNVEHCYLNDLGGGGIYLGDFSPQQGNSHTRNIRLHNNIIQTGGQEFPSAVGVWVGHSSDNEISHNDIANFYYSGISVGWIWGYDHSNAKRNTITNNHIHHIGWALLSDMAAVYTLGKSEGTIISNNVVHHVHAYSYGGWGLYTDEGSSDIVMENNLVYSTKTGGFHQHYGKNNTIRNNIFAFAKLYQVQCTRVEKHRSFNFQNNIVVFDEGVVLKGSWEKIDIYMDNNLYWNYSGDNYDFNGQAFKEWKKSGNDKNSVIANPYFKDALKYDFKFKNKRSIKQVGFIPFDYRLAGVYGNEVWMRKAKLPLSIIEAFDHEVKQNLEKK
ncbi:right-handed parallel beta-helix repeat-containing protein [Prolixibacteraceae bacterium Z1-6]|uniref:Right-handed parallel beta-helix repeat-containing protein n=1 Tax=Draconibacterium aestuarii TaxID=2998507 RepID=A0A9X3F2K7_9BACT|nr:right-handed parallel beta-helix repeat-containing protein [Prolixibacteraceae bacterium Z1-6]